MKRIVYYIFLIIIISVISVVASEILIRFYLFVNKEGDNYFLKNTFYSNYHLLAYKVRPLNMNFLRSNYSTDIYLNGLKWHHETDKFGFRNPEGTAENSDVLLFGDSFIYGHGVNYDQTVAHHLRKDYRINAYSMGRSSDCLYQNYVLFRMYVSLFRPKKVIIFTFFNDVEDLVSARSDSQLSDIPEKNSYNYNELLKIVQNHKDNFSDIARDIRYKLYSYRLFRAMGTITKSLLLQKNEMNQLDNLSKGVYSRDNYRAIEKYYLVILGDIKHICIENNIDFIIINICPIITDRNKELKSAIDAFDSFIKIVSDKTKITYFNTKDLFGNRPEYYLPVDEHLSGAGNKKLAAFIAQRLSL